MFVPERDAPNLLEETGMTALELVVNNHPGVMSHVCGLFSRRAFNLEGIFCLPRADGSTSRIWLLVNRGRSLEQIVKQVAKLQDVLAVRPSREGAKVFAHMERWVDHGATGDEEAPARA